MSVRYLVAEGTVDEHLKTLIDGKLAVLGKAGLSRDDFTESEVRRQQKEKQKTMKEYWEEDDGIDEALR